jgi:hypothetical protein
VDAESRKHEACLGELGGLLVHGFLLVYVLDLCLCIKICLRALLPLQPPPQSHRMHAMAGHSPQSVYMISTWMTDTEV